MADRIYHALPGKLRPSHQLPHLRAILHNPGLTRDIKASVFVHALADPDVPALIKAHARRLLDQVAVVIYEVEREEVPQPREVEP